MNKFYFLASAIVLSAASMSAAVINVGDLQFTTIDDSTAKLSKFNGTSGDIVIPASVNDGTSDYAVVEIAASVFRSKSITSVVVPGSVKIVGTQAFNMCRSLTKATFEEGVESLGYQLFNSCGSLTEVSLPSTLTCLGADYLGFDDGQAFNGCSALTEITIPSGITVIPSKTFYGCSSLATVNGLSQIETIATQAFNNCSKLSGELSFPAVTSVGSNAFGYCAALEKVSFGDKLKALPNEVFYGCEGLRAVDFGSALESVGSRAFNNCSRLESVVFPATMTTISADAFAGCTGINTVTCYASVPPTASDSSFAGDVYKNASLYVPTASLDTYKEAEVWKNFENIVSVATGVEMTEAGEAAVAPIAGGLRITGGIKADVYALDGRKVASAAEGDVLLPDGVYVVVTPAMQVKVFVK